MCIVVINSMGGKLMKKVELVEAVASKANLTKADALRALDATVEVLTDALAKGDRIPLVGFGTFAVSRREARTGRNPQTGEEIKIEAATTPAFKAGKALKDKVNK